MHRWLIAVTVFVSAAAVLVLEIVAGRILAPYVGVSLQTFTGIIGTILAAIALGAWAGGRLADRYDPETLLGPAVMAGAVLAVLSPALVYVVGPSAAGESAAAIISLAAIGFFLPAVVLSTITPIAAKLLLHSLDTTGAVVGQLSAIGTAGAIFGTFITGFFLVAAIPSQPITWVVGAVLLVLGIILTLPMGRAPIIGAIVVFAVSAMGSAAIAAPCDYETAYSCALIVDRDEGPAVKALILDTFVNSVVDVEDPTYLSSRYARVIDAVIMSRHQTGPAAVAYIGGGGYTLPRYYDETADASAVVMEIDGELPAIAVTELGLIEGPWLETLVGDARLSSRTLDDGTFDAIVGDAFSGRSVPWHLTTREFVAELASKLTTDGLYVLNVIDHPPLEFVRAELATLGAVFDHVAVVAPEAYLAGGRGGNFILVGSTSPIDHRRITETVTDGEVVLVDTDARAWAGQARVLRDEFAPTDQLLSRP